MKYISYTLSIIGLCILLMTCIWSNAFLQGLSASSYIQAVVTSNILLSSYRVSFISDVIASIDKIEQGMNYNKTMYQVYHYISKAAQAMGRVADARTYLMHSITYHPYYLNGYKELADIQLFLGKKSAAKACQETYKAIIDVKVPKQSALRECRQLN